MKRIIFIANLLLLFTTIEVAAQQSERPVTSKFLIEGGIEYGGDEILEVFFRQCMVLSPAFPNCLRTPTID